MHDKGADRHKEAIKTAIVEHAKELVSEAMREMAEEVGYPLTRLGEFVNAARVGQLLHHVLTTANTIFLSNDSEANEDGEKEIHIAARPERGEPSNVSRTTILAALEAICGKQRKKRCPRCNGGKGARKPLSEFPLNAAKADGRSNYCKVCERARKQKYDERKKGNADA